MAKHGLVAAALKALFKAFDDESLDLKQECRSMLFDSTDLIPSNLTSVIARTLVSSFVFQSAVVETRS